MNPANPLPPLELDPRFIEAVRCFQEGDFDLASDGFEELFFESVREELPLVRLLLQVSVGVFHAQCGQRRPAVERLQEGMLAMGEVTDDRGFDLLALGSDVLQLIAEITAGGDQIRPRLVRRRAST